MTSRTVRRRTCAATCAVLVGTLLTACSASGILSVADRFQAPGHWHLAEDIVVGPRLICISDTPCPSVQRRWELPLDQAPTTDELQGLVDDAGFDADVDGSCDVPSRTDTWVTTCEVETRVEGYDFAIDVLSNVALEETWVSLSVTP